MYSEGVSTLNLVLMRNGYFVASRAHQCALEYSFRIHTLLLKIAQFFMCLEKNGVSVCKLFLICYLILKFLMDMHCKRLFTERKCCDLQLEHAIRDLCALITTEYVSA